MKTLYLLDAYALIYRAYYALIRAPRINSKGMNTSAIFGFVNTLDEVLRKENPDYIGIAFDPSGPTFRHEMYPEYKAQREATPEDIRKSVPIIKDIVHAFRIPLLEVPGYEADDVIGSMAKRAAAEGFAVTMVTPDKDYAQLVDTDIRMFRPGHGATPAEILDAEAVKQKYGLATPAQVIDLLALMGDTADNIPGCAGVGAKTAEKLLAEFGTVEQLLARTSELRGALRTKVETSAEQIRLSKQLATICTDVPLPLAPEELIRKEKDAESLRKIFEDLEFRTFINRILKPEKPARKIIPEMGDLFAAEFTDSPEENSAPTLGSLKTTPHEYHLVEKEEEIAELARILLTKEKISLDTETTSTDWAEAKLVGLSFSTEDFRAWYVSVPRETTKALKIVNLLRPVYENEKILKVGQNLKYDLNVLSSYGVELRGPLFDTMLAHYVCQPELRHNMDDMAEAILHYRTIHIDELIGPKGKGQLTMDMLPPAAVCDYACEDADVTLRLMAPLEAEMQKNGVEELFRTIEMPLLPVLARMERNGVRLDTAALAETGRHFGARMAELEAQIYELAGHSFSITSPKQVGEVLFEELRLSEKAKKTKTGQYSTSEEVLEALKGKHPIVSCILAHRALKKLLGTYVEALPKLVNTHTGRIHTSFNQAVTATGRLSSSNPNLQNIPVRGEDGREIRKAFIPEPGHTFFSADYSQIELRIMAHLSQDEAMLADFRGDKDIHAATAARIFHKSIEDISRDERRKAKTANFGIIYGISAFGLAERMEVSRTEARDLIESYFQTYPRVRSYIDESIAKARAKGFIETAFGRRRFLPDITSGNATVRGFAERNAVNAPIQGTAADIIKLAMIRIDAEMQRLKLQSKMILQVHDELNFSVAPGEEETLRSLVIREMESAFRMSVPLKADCGWGGNWLEAH